MEKSYKVTVRSINNLLFREDESNYGIDEFRYFENSVLELDRSLWSFYMTLGYDDTLGMTELQYWLVNGEKRLSLDDIRVTEDMTIEPCIKYKNTRYRASGTWLDGEKQYYNLEKVQNADEELHLSPQGADYEMILENDVFAKFFDNRFNVMPKKIVVDTNVSVGSDGMVFEKISAGYMREYVAQGGVLEIQSGHKELIMVQDKMLCSVDGKVLLHYLPQTAETEASLHARIEEVAKNAFAGGDSYISLDLSNAKIFDLYLLQDCPNLERIRFGAQVAVHSTTSQNHVTVHSLQSMLHFAPNTLKSVTFSEYNTEYWSENGFVARNKNGDVELIYALGTVGGKIRVPDGITKLVANAFRERGTIEEIILPASLRKFTEIAFDGMKNLQKITFDGCEEITSIREKSLHATLPALTELEFKGDIKRLNFLYDDFLYANLGMLTLPNGLREVKGMTRYCAGYAISPNNTAVTSNLGGLYYNDGEKTTLVSYAAKKTATEYKVVGADCIGERAFYGDGVLQEVFIPASVKEIGVYAFANSALQKIEFNFTQSLVVQGYAFEGCRKLKEVVVPSKDSTFFLYRYAFSECESLTAFPIEQVTMLSDRAFRQTGLKEAAFHTSLTYIPSGVFEYCEELETVTFNNVQTIGESAFRGCASLQALESARVLEIYDHAFMDSGITKALFACVAVIDTEAFRGCASLQTVAFAETVEVRAGAFRDCVNLAAFESKLLWSVQESAFENCKKIERILIETPQSDTFFTIEARAFAGCESLKEVYVTGYNPIFKDGVFDGCTALKKVVITSSHSTMSALTFGSLSHTVGVWLNVKGTFVWSGVVPKSFVLYVPAEYEEYYKENLLVNTEQIIPYDFTEQSA